MSNSIYSLNRSKNGTWWIGTGGGLQRFDGYTFEPWNEVADTAGVKINASQNVYEDSRGNVWVFNFSEHYVIPAGLRRLTPVRTDSLSNIPETQSYPVPVLEDSLRLWCFETSKGFFGFNKRTLLLDTLVPVAFKSESVVLPTVSTLDSVAWVSVDYEDSSYVVRFRPGEKIRRYTLPGSHYGRVKGVIQLNAHDVLFISTRYTAICDERDVRTPVTMLSTENIPGNFIRGLPYARLRVNNPGGVLFPGEQGLYEYVPDKKILRPYSTVAYPQINLSRQLMFALHEDQRGNIWIGRDASDGLLIYYPGKLSFEFLHAPRQYFNLVYSLAVTDDGRVIAANFQKGLNIFDKTGTWKKHIPLPNAENGLSPSIRAINRLNSEQYLMKSLFDKLMVLDVSNDRITDLSAFMPGYVTRYRNVFDANIYPVRENEAHFTHGKYILSVQYAKPGYRVAVIDSLNDGGIINSITYSREGKRIIGTSQGIYQQDGHWKLFSETRSFGVKFITTDSAGNIWATGPGGICRIGINHDVKFYTEGNGLLNEFVYGILFDDAGNAWYSSNRGLGCIRPDGSISFFTEADGLQGDEFDTQSFWKDSTGKLYFGGINGITAFYPRNVLKTLNTGEVLLSAVQVNGLAYPQEGRADDLKKLTLPHDQNSLTFNFAFTNLSDAAYNVYQVRLAGHDKQWVNLKNLHTIRYLLTPGDYTLYVKGSSDGNTWSKELTLPITIHPALWQTAMFKWAVGILIMAAFGFGAWYFNKIKTQELLRQLQLEQEMQRERERISRDLHDHIGAYSTALLANADSLEQQVQGDKMRATVSYLKENSRHILSALRETIWLLNTRNLTVSGFYEGFINYSSNILRNHEGIEIEFHDDIVRNVQLQPTTAIQLLRILQEVIQNIIKHAHAGKIRCELTCSTELRIVVADDGRGFMPDTTTPGNGLRNMRERAAEAGFRLDLISSAGAGTKVIVSGMV